MKLHPSAQGLSLSAPLHLRISLSTTQFHLNALQIHAFSTRSSNLRTAIHYWPRLHTISISQQKTPSDPIFPRHASTSTATTRATTPATRTPSTTTPSKLASHSQPLTRDRETVLRLLNPPSTAYPPPLNVAPRAPGQNWVSYLFKSGKTYLTFYKTGIRHVYTNYKSAKAIKNELRKKENTNEKGKGKAGNMPLISRADWQLLRRSRRDIRRLLPFGALVLLLGEWLPLVALWITPLVPGPCRIPAQVRKETLKRETRQRKRMERYYIRPLPRSSRRSKEPSPKSLEAAEKGSTDREQLLRHMNKEKLLQISSNLDAHSGIWDFVRVDPPVRLLRWLVSRRLEYLQTDDNLIKRDGGVGVLNEEEIRIAAQERGFETLEKSTAELRKAVNRWILDSTT